MRESRTTADISMSGVTKHSLPIEERKTLLQKTTKLESHMVRTCTVLSHPPLTSRFGSVGLNFREKTRFEWPGDICANLVSGEKREREKERKRERG